VAYSVFLFLHLSLSFISFLIFILHFSFFSFISSLRLLLHLFLLSSFLSSSVSSFFCLFLRYPQLSGSVPIWLDDLDCSDSRGRRDMRVCSHSGVGINNCGHHEDVFLSCIKCKYDGRAVFLLLWGLSCHTPGPCFNLAYEKVSQPVNL